jgi:hypothetical protein
MNPNSSAVKIIGCFISVSGKRGGTSTATDDAAHVQTHADDVALAKEEWFSARAGRPAISMFEGSVRVQGDRTVR